MQIFGLTKTTLLDYPGRVAAVLFTGGCSFRCPFCHNGGLVISPSEKSIIPEEEVFDFLQKRRSVLSGVCISGGEPALQPDLPAFLYRLKSTLGYDVKLDTNGYHPDVLQCLIKEKLIDYIAMDIKAGPDNYGNVCGLPGLLLDRIHASIQLLQGSGLTYEFRTTVVKELHTEHDFIQIADWIAGSPAYFLQSYTDSGQVLSPGFHACTKQELSHFLAVVQRRIPNATLRGID